MTEEGARVRSGIREEENTSPIKRGQGSGGQGEGFPAPERCRGSLLARFIRGEGRRKICA